MRDATERILQALGPSIEVELDRAITETRQQLEDEFQGRLQSALESALHTAIEDAELGARQEVESRLQEAIREASEATRVQLTESFDAQMDSTSQRIRSELQEKADQDLQAAQSTWAAERQQLQGEVDRWRAFADAQRQFSESLSQTEILYRFLQLSGSFAASLAIYVSKGDGLGLWQSRGGLFPQMISGEIRDSETYFKSIVVRDKVVAAVCSRLPFDSTALDFMISCLERAIETFGMRMKTAAPHTPLPQPANGSYV
jgi:hypothetical protein